MSQKNTFGTAVKLDAISQAKNANGSAAVSQSPKVHGNGSPGFLPMPTSNPHGTPWGWRRGYEAVTVLLDHHKGESCEA